MIFISPDPTHLPGFFQRPQKKGETHFKSCKKMKCLLPIFLQGGCIMQTASYIWQLCRCCLEIQHYTSEKIYIKWGPHKKNKRGDKMTNRFSFSSTNFSFLFFSGRLLLLHKIRKEQCEVYRSNAAFCYFHILVSFLHTLCFSWIRALQLFHHCFHW